MPHYSDSPVPENQVIADLAEKAAAHEPITIQTERPTNLLGFVLGEDQRLETVDLEKYAMHPAAADGAVTLHDAASFVTYVNRYRRTDRTTVWSRLTDQGATLTAVLDDHGIDNHIEPADRVPGLPGHGRHRATLQLQPTPEWQHWTKFDGRMLTQAAFAEHIEDGVESIREPSAAEMLEVAQTFHARRNVNFRSAKRLDSGEMQLQWHEEIESKAGKSGDIMVPTTITLGLAPFEGMTEVYSVIARFRYRLNEGALTMGYRLIRPDQVRKIAFTDIVSQVSEGLGGHPIMAGVPRS